MCSPPKAWCQAVSLPPFCNHTFRSKWSPGLLWRVPEESAGMFLRIMPGKGFHHFFPMSQNPVIWSPSSCKGTWENRHLISSNTPPESLHYVSILDNSSWLQTYISDCQTGITFSETTFLNVWCYLRLQLETLILPSSSASPSMIWSFHLHHCYASTPPCSQDSPSHGAPCFWWCPSCFLLFLSAKLKLRYILCTSVWSFFSRAFFYSLPFILKKSLASHTWIRRSWVIKLFLYSQKR